jgi:uncharacterized membrane protein
MDTDPMILTLPWLASMGGAPLGVVGRLHPLILHMPIGLVGALVILEAWRWWRGEPRLPSAALPLVWMNAATGAAAAISGLVLANEPGYAGLTLDRHRLLGIVLGVVGVLLAIALTRGIRRLDGRGLGGYRFLLAACALLLVPVGHLGATMTHGEGFLTAPLASRTASDIQPIAKPAANSEEATHADSMPSDIRAILERTCTACHGASRTKGLLALHTMDAVRAGGEHGEVVRFGKPDESTLVYRIELPLDDDDHMPPAGKPQLTAAERARLREWVSNEDRAAGGNLANAAATAPSLTTVPPAPAAPKPDLAAIEALKARLVHVQPLAGDSPLLWIDFAATTGVNDDDLRTLLSPLLAFVGDLSLARTNVTDASAKFLVNMRSLHRLDLRDTAITDESVRQLNAHPSLQELILVGTKATDASLEAIRSLPKLSRLYVWRTAISRDALVALRAERPGLLADADESTTSAAIETEPVLAFSSDAPLPGATAAAPGASIEPINSVCPVSGAAVCPTYVIVWEGKAIGLCCEKCAAQFWADPKRYAAAVRPK